MAKGNQGCSCWVKGCAGLCVFLLLAMIGVGYYLYTNRASIAATGIEILAESVTKGLPEDQQKEIMTVVCEQTDKIRNDQIGQKEAESILREIYASPAGLAILGNVVEAKFFQKSALPEDVKNDAHLQINRMYRAALKKVADPSDASGKRQIRALSKETLEKLRNMFFVEKKKDQWELRSDVPAPDLTRAVELMKKTCDDLGIVEEYVKIDIAGELRKALQKAEENVKSADAGL